MATIYCGDALEVLKALPTESVQMAMTSPPYWGLRNYASGTDIVWGGDENCEHEWTEETQGLQHENRNNLRGTQEEVVGKTGTVFIQKYDRLPAGICVKCGAWRGQLGLEPTPELYVEHLMMVLREVKRVLRKDGSFYLNIGDTYASGKGTCFNPGGGKNSLQGHAKLKEARAYPLNRGNKSTLTTLGLQPKCMVYVPERVMFAMIDDGWVLRNKLVWHKPNSMPSSVKDRFSTTYEMLYFFVKQRKYYFDLDAVRVPPKAQSLERYQGTDNLFGHGPQPQSFNLRIRDVKRGKGGTFVQGGEVKELQASEQEVEEYEYPEKMQRHHGSGPQYKLTGLGRGLKHDQASLHRSQQKHEDSDLGAQKPARKRHSGYFGEDGQPLVDFVKGKNPGDLWSLTTKPSSISVCPQCDTVFPRLMKICPNCKIEGVVGHFAPYPEALCEDPIKVSSKEGDTVLDMFAGGGSTGVAAKRLGRKAILIDCVRPYCIMARYKLKRVEYQPELEHSYQNI